MAKAITGGYGALGAVITTAQIAEAIKEELGLYSTYGWHPRSVAVALANVRYLTRHQAKLLRSATQLGIEVEDEKYASRVGDTCRKNACSYRPR